MSAENITIIPLFSGSSGNCVFIRFGDTRILVDIGRTTKQIVEALEQIGEDPTLIDAVLITHDHSDHICGLDVFVRKYGVHTYAASSTWSGIRFCQKKPHAELFDHVIEPWESFSVGSVEIMAFPTPHDAQGSCGYRLRRISVTSATMFAERLPEVKQY
jgi:phosphoribosyl 1,2-cyclic phosphodiesterase